MIKKLWQNNKFHIGPLYHILRPKQISLIFLLALIQSTSYFYFIQAQFGLILQNPEGERLYCLLTSKDYLVDLLS